MASRKISALALLTSPNNQVEVPCIDLSEAAVADQNKAIELAALLTAILQRKATIAALKAETFHEDGLLAVALGGTSRGDGNGGFYYFDSASAAADDGISVLEPDDSGGGNGRWLKFI